MMHALSVGNERLPRWRSHSREPLEALELRSVEADPASDP